MKTIVQIILEICILNTSNIKQNIFTTLFYDNNSLEPSDNIPLKNPPAIQHRSLKR